MIENPYLLDTVTKIDNPNIVFAEKVFKDLLALEKTGQTQFKDFWNERLVTCVKSLDETIKKNSLLTPGNAEDQKTEKRKKLSYSNEMMNKLRSAAYTRKEMTEKLFE